MEAQRVLHEIVRVKSGMPWRPQDIGDAIVMGYLPQKATKQLWNQTKRDKYIAVNKAERSWKHE